MRVSTRMKTVSTSPNVHQFRGCLSQGESEVEAETNLADAIRECIAVRAEKGLPLIVPRREIEISV